MSISVYTKISLILLGAECAYGVCLLCIYGFPPPPLALAHVLLVVVVVRVGRGMKTGLVVPAWQHQYASPWPCVAQLTTSADTV